jgi:outer membrane protein assembly factor BamA
MLTCKSIFLRITLFLSAICPADALWLAQDRAIRIGSIVVEGNRAIAAHELRLLFRMSQEGSEYIPENLQADLRQVEKTYQDLGFVKVQLETPKVEVQSATDGKIATIRIVVREGPRYTTGKVSVNDTKALASGTLLQLSPMQKGQPYSPFKAGLWQSKVEDSYREIGYMRARCPVREMVNEAVNTIDCAMECVEGKLYTVGKITVGGDGSVNPVEFKRRLLFSEGGTFNPEMFLTSLQFINQARLYAPISSSDVEIRIDDDKGTVDLWLRVVSREPVIR